MNRVLSMFNPVVHLFTAQLKEAKCAQKITTKKHETVRKDLPTFSAADVAKHSDE